MNFQELPRLKDSISYLYLEHAVIEQENSALVVIQKDGRIPVPVAGITCLLLGPGISITHAAVKTLCANGCMAIWCGENVGRFYASGIGETGSAENLLKQAKCCIDGQLHMDAVRRMYAIRFPRMDTSSYSLQQIRGMEGIRVRKTYELMSKTTGVKWKKRNYDKQEWDAADPVNRALSEANSLLYGVCHAAIVSLGYSPGLGFVHSGKQLSFVYDIADLYKAETTIPAAFNAVKDSQSDSELSKNIRLYCRRYFSQAKLLSRIPNDIAWILQTSDTGDPLEMSAVGNLWDEQGSVSGGVNYAEKDELA